MLNEVTLKTPQTKEYFVTKYASISFIPASMFAVCTVIAAYIPIPEFKELFIKIGELVKKKKLLSLFSINGR